MTVGGRTYDILSFLRRDGEPIKGNVMVDRAKKRNAHQSKSEREYLLAHQNEIPAAFQGEVVFLFTNDRHPDHPEDVCCVGWSVDRWVPFWSWLAYVWSDDCRVLRRKSA